MQQWILTTIPRWVESINTISWYIKKTSLNAFNYVNICLIVRVPVSRELEKNKYILGQQCHRKTLNSDDKSQSLIGGVNIGMVEKWKFIIYKNTSSYSKFYHHFPAKFMPFCKVKRWSIECTSENSFKPPVKKRYLDCKVRGKSLISKIRKEDLS